MWLLLGALASPGSTSLYIATTRGHAKRILWPTIKRLAAAHGLRAAAHETDQSLELPNGATVWLTGCPDDAHAEIYRGPAYRRVAIDEAGSFPGWLSYLIEDILEPALLDHNGDIALVGSPGVAPVGVFYDATGGPAAQGIDWSVHHWTVLDNPAIPGAKAWLEQRIRAKGWQWDHPTVRREWLGQWILDASMLVYRWSQSVEVPALPEGDWTLGRSPPDPHLGIQPPGPLPQARPAPEPR